MASELGLTYMCASTDPRVKNSYNKAPRVSKPLTDEQKKRRRAARLIKIGNNALSLNPVPPPPRKRPVKRYVQDAVSEFLTGAITDATLRQGMADADREIIDIANAMGASGNAPLSIPSLDAMMMGGVSSSAPKKKRAKPGKGKQTVPFYLKPGGRKKPKKDSKMKPPKPPTTFTPLSAEEMAFHANLLG